MNARSLRFQAAVLALFYISTDSSVLAFTTTTGVGMMGQSSSLSLISSTRTAFSRHQQQPLSTLYAVHTSALSANDPARPASTIRPTDQEQREFLQKAVELRRLKGVQKEQAALVGTAARGNKPGMTTLRLAQAAGYGDDFDAYEQALGEGYRAREALVTRNMGLVYYCVNEIVGKRGGKLQSLSREDLIQEGAIGLARAVDKWNPAIGGKFSTYAVYWVRAAVLRGIAERDDLVRVPEHVSAAVAKVTKAAAQLGINIDGDNLLTSVYSSSKEASWKEAKAAKALAEQAGVTEAQLAQAIKVRERRNKGMASFETWMQKGRDFESDTAALLESSNSASSASEQDSNVSQEVLRQELSKYLRPREMEALSWRYGLLTTADAKSSGKKKKNYLARAEEELFGGPSAGGRWGEAMSFNEVGKRMHVSAEYGRRLCHAALAKLRRAAEDGNLSLSLLTL